MSYNKSVLVPVRMTPASFFAATSPQIHDTSFAKAEFQLDDLCQSAWEQMRAIEEHGLHPAHIILGRDFYVRFLGNLNDSMRSLSSHPIDFTVPLNYGGNGPCDPRTKFAGCAVHCIPWIEGVAVLPKMNDFRPPPVRGIYANDWTVGYDGHVVGTPAGLLDMPEPPDPTVVKRILGALRKGFTKAMRRPLIEIATADVEVRIG